MRILVVGATGEIGSAVVEEALNRGHQVAALVRSPERLGPLKGRVEVLVGDLADEAAVAAAVQGRDAVISALGSSPDRSQLDVPATAARNLIAGMKRHGVRRFIGLAGGATTVPGERKPLSGRLASAIVRLLARNVVDAKQREFDVVSASGLDWTMIRPPRVVDGPATGRLEIGPALRAFRVTRGDVAVAMVELATSESWIGQAPYVSAPSR